MKRVFQLSAALLTGLVVFLQVQIVHADLCAPGFENLCKLKVEESGGNTIVGKIVTFLFIIAIVLALIYLIYGGIKYITSGGDKTKVDSARSHIIAAIVGLILAFLAYFIINIIGYMFGINISNLKIPQLV